MLCATVLYPTEARAPLDVEYYSKTLAPMYAEFLGDNCVNFEVRRGLTAPGAPSAKFGLIASFWVKSAERYNESLSDPRFVEVMAEFGVFTDIEPVRQFDEVITGTNA
jgi:uncharacterized protein (TIGR02118 family)